MRFSRSCWANIVPLWGSILPKTYELTVTCCWVTYLDTLLRSPRSTRHGPTDCKFR